MILTFHKVFDLLELAGKLTCTWPEDSSTSKWTNVLRNFRWIFALINVVVLLISLALGVYHHRRDFLLLMKTMSEVSATLDVFCDLVLCKMNSTQLQILIQRIRKYLETASEYENHVVQSYLDRYKEFYSVIVVAYIATGIFFTLAPLFLGQNLPADGWIPFSTESFGIYCIVYFVEAYCIWQAALIFVVDIMVVTLFCFTAARLDILGSKLKQVNCRELLVNCIKEHQEIIGFLEDTEDAVQSLLFKMNVTIGIAVVSATFPMLYRSQKPFLVSMGGLFPALSLEYYSQILIRRMKMHLETTNKYENKVIQSYIDRYKKFYSMVAMSYISTGILFCLMPLFSKQELPADGWIPFSIEPIGIYCIVYFAQVYCILQTALSFSFDYVIAILFCYTAARLDILGTKMGQVNCCELLTQSVAVTGQFLSMLLAGCGHMYLISWPSDDLKESSLRFAISVNDIQWIGKRQNMANSVLIMMRRSQKPFLITMAGGLLPPLSFEYYSQFLTTVSSYFMGMRTMIES
uniref:uncharacterized protein LOC117604073 n=1 Tax=Osmia lignaria TaxID=473952 RepID=UPI0014782801|nr:uncharacterized protein LOC117604073 [Osmia lignaria]